MAVYTEAELKDLIDQAQILADQISQVNAQMLDHIHNVDGTVTNVSDIRSNISSLQLQVADNSKIMSGAITTKDVKQPKSIVIYYGYPIAYKALWDRQKVIDDIASSYDIFVVGDSYQDPAHEVYADTQAIIAGLISKGVEIYGYVPIGTNTENRPMATLKTQVDQWVVLNVNGIFLDEFGFDYANSREKQINICQYCHDVGKKYMANAWVFTDFSTDNISDLPPYWAADNWKKLQFIKGNPNNLALPRNLDDSYLIENFCFDESKPADKWEMHERLLEIVSYNPNNYDLHSVAVYAETKKPNGNPTGRINYSLYAGFNNMADIASYIWASAYLYGLSSTGGNGYSFGSGGDNQIVTPIYSLPIALSTANRVGVPTFNNSTGVASVLYDDNRTTLSVTTDELTNTYKWEIIRPKELKLYSDVDLLRIENTVKKINNKLYISNNSSDLTAPKTYQDIFSVQLAGKHNGVSTGTSKFAHIRLPLIVKNGIYHMFRFDVQGFAYKENKKINEVFVGYSWNGKIIGVEASGNCNPMIYQNKLNEIVLRLETTLDLFYFSFSVNYQDLGFSNFSRYIDREKFVEKARTDFIVEIGSAGNETDYVKV